MASKRPHLSNPMCSVSGTWGADVSTNAGSEDAAQLRRSMHPCSSLALAFLSAADRWFFTLHSPFFTLLVALCTASSKPVFILYLNPPCSADAAHGVTEVQPLRGYARCRTLLVPPFAARCGICALTKEPLFMPEQAAITPGQAAFMLQRPGYHTPNRRVLAAVCAHN